MSPQDKGTLTPREEPKADIVRRLRALAEEIEEGHPDAIQKSPVCKKCRSIEALNEAADKIEAQAADLERLRTSRDEALEDAARVADVYAAKMRAAHAKPHPIHGRENTIALCKMDAGENIAKLIRSLKSTKQE